MRAIPEDTRYKQIQPTPGESSTSALLSWAVLVLVAFWITRVKGAKEYPTLSQDAWIAQNGAQLFVPSGKGEFTCFHLAIPCVPVKLEWVLFCPRNRLNPERDF